MRIPRLFVEEELATGNLVKLPAESSHYLNKVLRLQIAAPIRVFNGFGGEYSAHIVNIEKRSVTLELGDFIIDNASSPLTIHLGIGVSRGERMDLVVQKATELGVNAISPLTTERTEVKLGGDRSRKKLKHWCKIAISACEQSGLNLLPVIHAPMAIEQWLANRDEALKLVLHPHSESALRQHQATTPDSVALLVGPEGGFSDTEIVGAQTAGFQALQLGPRVLRTETAPIAALSILQYQWGDL